MKIRSHMTAGVSAIGLATAATLTLAAPTATAVPTFPDGFTPPGQVCQQARVVAEDGTPSTITGLPGVRCGQYLATLSGAVVPEQDTETEVPETDTETEVPVDETTEGSTEETSVEETTAFTAAADDSSEEIAVEEQETSDDGSSADRSGAWASKHQGNQQGNSKWAHKGKSHPHHPSNH